MKRLFDFDEIDTVIAVSEEAARSFYQQETGFSDEEMAKRKAEWKPRQPKITTGYLARYAKLVTSGAQGAVLE